MIRCLPVTTAHSPNQDSLCHVLKPSRALGVIVLTSIAGVAKMIDHPHAGQFSPAKEFEGDDSGW